jgi:hypothetical protein
VTTILRALPLAAVLGFADCGNTSGPVPIGRDTYMVTSTGAWYSASGAGLKPDLFRQANAFCAAQGKEATPTNAISNNSSMDQYAGAELDFMCLTPGDAQLGRPRPPGLVIQSR